MYTKTTHTKKKIHKSFSETKTYKGAYQEERSEIGEVPKELLDAHRSGIEGEVFSQVIVQLVHVVVHGGQLLALLPGGLCKDVLRCQGKTFSRRQIFTKQILCLLKD